MAVYESIDINKAFSIGEWQVTPTSLTIANSESSYQLPAKVFSSIECISRSSREVVSHSEFYEQVWQGNENVAKRGLTNAIWH